MSVLLLCLWNPRAAAERIKTSPRWILPFALLALLSVALLLARHPHIVQMTLGHLPPSATSEDKSIAEQALNDNLVPRCVFLPVRLFIGWASFALLVWYACRIWTSREAVRLHHILSLEVAAETIMVLGQAAAFAVAGSGANEAFLRIPLGADMFVRPVGDTVLAMALNSVNLFSIWYILALATGVSALYGIGRTKSFVSVVAAWALAQLVNTSVVFILRESMHLRL